MRSIKALAASAAVSVVAVGGMALPAHAQQTGLVNVAVGDVAILNNNNVAVQAVLQVPIGIAANVCNINVAALGGLIADGADGCTADADSAADSRAFQQLLARQGLRFA